MVRILLLMAVAGTLCSGQTVYHTVPPSMRVLRCVDWDGSDTNTLIGAGEGVVRWLDGAVFSGVWPRYDTTVFDHIIVVNDSIGVVLAKSGQILGLHLKNNAITTWPGLPEYGHRIMHCKGGFSVLQDSVVHLYSWQNGSFRSRPLEPTRGASTYCMITDTTLACVTPDTVLKWISVSSETVLFEWNPKRHLVWIHPINEIAVVGLSVDGRLSAFNVHKPDRSPAMSESGFPEHMVGFRPLTNGEGIVQSPGRSGYGGENAYNENFALGWFATARNVPRTIVAGITLPKVDSVNKRAIYVTVDGSWGYLDNNYTNVYDVPARPHLSGAGWSFVNTNDARHIAALSETRYGSELLARSSDGGLTWECDTLTRIQSIRSVRSNTNGAVFVNSNQQQVIRVNPPSLRRDTIWNRRNGYPLVRDLAVHADTILVTSIDTIGVSTDGGNTWQFTRHTSLEPITGSKFSDLYVSYSFHNDVWLSSQTIPFFIHTTDWGRSWKRIGKPPGQAVRTESMLRTSGGKYVMVMKEVGNTILCTLSPGDTAFQIQMRLTGPVTEDADGNLVMLSGNSLQRIDTSSWRLTGNPVPLPHAHLNVNGVSQLWYAGSKTGYITSGYWFTRWGSIPTSITASETASAEPKPLVYPNPSGSRVTITGSDVMVTSLTGIVMHSSAALSECVVNTSSWPIGLYLVHHRMGNVWYTSPLLVQR